ncbi:DUF4381 family protein [Lysobacter sp. A03]|uniref:DUF4381 family protein n=1 Tax=Lysobacter sp. A03 TaxID=1199154 RepID=UPI0005B74957|nr:DUF4381 family protein [Lysobacter sp. A03]KIQ97782.1 hypothetical protein TI01_0719 [Lysobacter sp. A03]
MQDPTLLLRDIHQPPAPPFWPPAPGWWLLAGAGLLVLGVVMAVRWERAQRRRGIAAIFDSAVAEAPTPVDEVAAISQLLRRAARRIDPSADRLRGDAWLEFLDRHAGDGRRRRRSGAADGGFAGAPGRLLLEGAFRPEIDVDPADVAALRSLARARFQQWMAAK